MILSTMPRQKAHEDTSNPQRSLTSVRKHGKCWDGTMLYSFLRPVCIDIVGSAGLTRRGYGYHVQPRQVRYACVSTEQMTCYK